MIYEEQESYAASRANGIGGTDAAAILNLSPWKRPIDIYAGKVNPGSLPELDKEMLWWGTHLEPIVRGRYQERYGVQVLAPADLGTVEKFPKSRPWRDSTLIEGPESWMLGAPDGWMPSVNSGLEVKCSSRRSDEWGPEGSDEVPAHYFVQASWYMAVCDAQGWNFATLFSGNKLEQFRLTRDLEFERNLIEVCRSFWFENVLKEVEPNIDESESYGKYLARKFSLGTEDVITEPRPEILEWTAKMKLAEDQMKEAEEAKQLANNHLRDLIGSMKSAKTPLGSVGWVRPKQRLVVDYKTFFEAVGVQHPVETAALTFPRHDAPYLRAWWKK